ncbi:MAG: DUF3996 domain-containing protein [Myxococcales bacterium]|nr:DUF3996 domain-containing protein [Myxococcales bacterium]
MTRKPLLAAVTLVVLVFAGTADARRRSFGAGRSNYTSNGKFGLGIELGAPSGLNGKLFLSPSTALNFGVGWLYDNYYRDADGLHLYLDHLWHPVSLTENPTFKLPFFVGVGGAFWSYDDRRVDGRDRDSALGLRVPLGLAFDFNNVPLDIFVQLTFVVDLFFNDRRDRFGAGFEGSVGVRFWFD